MANVNVKNYPQRSLTVGSGSTHSFSTSWRSVFCVQKNWCKFPNDLQCFDLIPTHLGYHGYCSVIVLVSVNWGHKFHGSKVLQVWSFQWRLLKLRSIVFELSSAHTSTSEITLASVLILSTLSINWITINSVMLTVKKNSCIPMLLVIFASFNAKGRLD